MNHFKFIIPAIIMMSTVSQAQQDMEIQEAVVQRGVGINPETSEWIKPEPSVAYRIPNELSQVPTFIRNNLGSLDSINRYIENPRDHFISVDQYLSRNAGSVVNLQFNNGKVDFYVIGGDTFRSKYAVVPKMEGMKNKKLVGKLAGAINGFDRFLISDPNVIGVQKVVPVPLVRASSLGYDRAKEYVFQAPAHWGDGQVQVKPAGQDCFFAFEIIETKEGKIVAPYIIAEEHVRLNNGTIESRPVDYVPTDEVKIILERSREGLPPEMPESYKGKVGRNIHTGEIVLPQKFGYLPEYLNGKKLAHFIGDVVGTKTAAATRAERQAREQLKSGEAPNVERAVEKGRKAR